MDNLSPLDRKRTMKAVHANNTKPEILVRKLLHRLGYRFRIHRKDLPGKPDLVLPKFETVIFVQGCFWHQHLGCPRSKRPDSRREYWDKKLDGNIQRDIKNFQLLKLMGWRVFEIWECELRNSERLERKIHTHFDALKG